MQNTKRLAKHLWIGTVLTTSLLTLGVAQAGTPSIYPIVGGTEVAANHTIAKRTVALFFWLNSGGNGLCTGSIVDQSHILTAAHCVQGFKQGAVIFSTGSVIEAVKSAASKGLAATPSVRMMTEVKSLPGYQGQQGGNDEFNDLAVITFNGGLPSGYEPAHFLSNSSLAVALNPKTPVILSGYGVTSAPIESGAHNGGASGGSGSGKLRQVQVAFSGLSPKKINAYFRGNPGHDNCHGDSGGPALVNVSGDLYVVGVASRSDCRTFSIYTVVNRDQVSSIMSTLKN